MPEVIQIFRRNPSASDVRLLIKTPWPRCRGGKATSQWSSLRLRVIQRQRVSGSPKSVHAPSLFSLRPEHFLACETVFGASIRVSKALDDFYMTVAHLSKNCGIILFWPRLDFIGIFPRIISASRSQCGSELIIRHCTLMAACFVVARGMATPARLTEKRALSTSPPPVCLRPIHRRKDKWPVGLDLTL